MAYLEEHENGTMTALKNGCVLVQRIERVLKNGAKIAETVKLDVISPGDDITAEDQAVKTVVTAARSTAFSTKQISMAEAYKGLIRRRAKGLQSKGQVYAALILLRKIGE